MNVAVTTSANRPAPFGTMVDPVEERDTGAVAIGRLVDARIRQLRQLCRARGLFEIDI